jgi:predicted MFS family arabinose efflux permease
VFRILWFAQLGSNIGTWMQSVGAQWFLLETTHSSALVAWVQTASLVPVLLFSLVAGVLADSVDRRILLIVMNAASTLAAGVLCVLGLTGALAPWSLLTMTFVLGCLSALTNPAWQAIQPDLVPREEIPAAASLSSVTVNGARAVGPALAGVLVSLGGPSLVFALNAISFVGVLLAVVWWKRPREAPALGRERFLPAMTAGLRYVRSAPSVRRILLRAGLFAVPACVLWALLPNVASTNLRLGSAGYGLLLGVLGVGAVLGVVIMPVLRRRLSTSWILAGSAIVYALGLVAPASGSLPIVAIAFVLAGLAWIATLTTLNAALQLTLAGWVRARGMAAYLLVFMGGQGVASFVWGVAAQAIGAQACFFIGAGLLVLVAVSVVLWPLHPSTGTLDRTIVALCSAAPTLVLDPSPTDGPVVVAVRYTVAAENEDAFIAAMSRLEKSRRRTGASDWRLDRSGEEAHVFREEFVVPSWGEFSRGAQERWTGYDRQVLDDAVGLSDGHPREEHYLPVS